MVNAGDVNGAPRGGARARGRRGDALARRLALMLALAGPPTALITPAWAGSPAGAPPAQGPQSGPGPRSSPGPQSGQVSNSSQAWNQVTTVDSSAEGQATFLRVRGTRKAAFKVHRLENPARVVIDLPQTRLAPAVRAGGAGWSVKSWAVDRVSAHESAQTGPGGVQVVVWLARPGTFRVSNDGNDLTVLLIAREDAPAPGQEVAPTPAAKKTIAAKVAAKVAPAAAPASTRAPTDSRKVSPTKADTIAAAEQALAARRADLRRAEGKARQARHAANKAVRRRWRNSMRLRHTARRLEADVEVRGDRVAVAEQELASLRAAPGGASPSVSGSAGGRVASADPVVGADPIARGVPVQARPGAPLPLRRQGSPMAGAGASASAAAASSPSTTPTAPVRSAPKAPAPAAPAAAPPKPPAAATPDSTDYASPEVASYGASSGPITQQSMPQNRRRKVYRGKKMDLDLMDTDVHNLMRLLADVGDVNIVVPDDIKARVTVRLRDVPWDQAMEVILASKGLWYRREGGLIRVAPRKELDAEDQAEAERMRAMAESEAPETQVFTLNYSVASKVRDQLTPLLSPKGRIEVDERTNSLIINDLSAHRRRIVGLVTQLDYQTPQIQIEARIIEARTTFNREFGIQWGGNVNASAAGGNSTGLVFPNSVAAAGGADAAAATGVAANPSDFAVSLPASVGQGAGGAIGLALGSVGGNVNLNLRLSAAEDSGTVRIISAPRITTSNNIEATIKSGTSIPISVISANGVQTQFVPADLLLRVTPAVSQRDCAVSMQVNVTKNEADFVNTGARGDPSILTKEAKTTILVADGQTAVIGGIYTRNTGLAYQKVPFFADIPVLGWLFKHRAENDDRSEVLVFITPKITNRAFLRCQ